SFAGLDALKYHARSWPGVQNWKVSRFAASLSGTQKQARIDFAIVGQVQSNMPGATEHRVLSQLPIKAASGKTLLGGSELSRGLAQLAA
ncbi:hypothetical protein N4Q54_26440, partial [Leclercia adecarboxylata]